MRLVGGKVEQTGEEEATRGVVTISGEWFINPGFWIINGQNIIGRSRRVEWVTIEKGEGGCKDRGCGVEVRLSGGERKAGGGGGEERRKLKVKMQKAIRLRKAGSSKLRNRCAIAFIIRPSNFVQILNAQD
jgi:hypothetical protein